MIQLFTTGGTIEGIDYSKESSKSVKNGITIEELLSQSKVSVEYSISQLLSKDSRFITIEDRELIATTINDITINKILITHGTYTMVETAQYLGKLNLNKTIVLTGAVILGTEPNSDASFNLG